MSWVLQFRREVVVVVEYFLVIGLFVDIIWVLNGPSNFLN